MRWDRENHARIDFRGTLLFVKARSGYGRVFSSNDDRRVSFLPRRNVRGHEIARSEVEREAVYTVH